MPKASPPSVLVKFQGRRDYPVENEIDDWGLNPVQQESYVEQFRRILAARNAWHEDIDYFTLRRFLRARNYDMEKATAMWMAHLAWREEFKVDTVLKDFHFEERDQFLKCYPQGYHKIDKMGRPIYIQLIGKINLDEIKKITTEERMLKFHIQEYERLIKVILPICARLENRNIDQTFGIMDVRGIGMSHLTGEVRRLLALVAKYDQDNYPEMLGHICIINAPTVFRFVWNIVKNLIDARTQSKIEILGTNYKDALYKWVDPDNVPDWLGGLSTGTLSDDVGPWNDPELVSKIGMNVEDLKSGKRPVPLHADGRAHEDGEAVAPRLSLGGPAPSFARTSHTERAGSIASNEGGFASASGSSGEFPRSSSRRHSGVHQDVLDEAARRYQASMSGRELANGAAGHSTVFEAIPEVSTAKEKRPQTLVDRIAALEKLLPSHTERLKQHMQLNGGVAGLKEVTAAHSTRSAPQGSLINRVEALEEAMDLLLAAQETSLRYQHQQLLEIQRLREKESEKPRARDRCCGCCVM